MQLWVVTGFMVELIFCPERVDGLNMGILARVPGMKHTMGPSSPRSVISHFRTVFSLENRVLLKI